MTVTRCYGCGMEITNPPKIPLEEITIVSWDAHKYMHRLTGQFSVAPILKMHFSAQV